MRNFLSYDIDLDFGNTPLIWAVEGGHRHVVEWLLEIEAKHPGIAGGVNTKGYLGNTAVSRACRHGLGEILWKMCSYEKVLEEGAGHSGPSALVDMVARRH